MARKKKKKKSGGSAVKAEAAGGRQALTVEGGNATAPSPASAPLETRRGLRVRPKKLSAKEQSAIAKKAARANWDQRMTAEGR